MLEPVLLLGLRLACGAFRTIPVESLYIECHEWSLYHQKIYTDMYASKSISMTNHPFDSTIHDASSEQLVLNRPSVSMSCTQRVIAEGSELAVAFSDVHKTGIVDFIAPWQLQVVCWDLSFFAIQQNQGTKSIYSAAFPLPKTAKAVYRAVHGPNLKVCERMNSHNSILRQEHTVV